MYDSCDTSCFLNGFLLGIVGTASYFLTIKVLIFLKIRVRKWKKIREFKKIKIRKSSQAVNGT
jgi:hypothetical protein